MVTNCIDVHWDVFWFPERLMDVPSDRSSVIPRKHATGPIKAIIILRL